MTEQVFFPQGAISDYVKDILLFENNSETGQTLLPFYADGFPGIMFAATRHGIHLLPQQRELSELILYGQTLVPIELSMRGSYRLIVFRLYPFASKMLLGVDPKQLNDDCFDLKSLGGFVQILLKKLNEATNTDQQLTLMTAFIADLAQRSAQRIDPVVRKAIEMILDAKGTVTVRQLREALNVGERTFERLFMGQIGIPPKKFARIIQFQQSLEQLTQEDYLLMTDVVFDNGFADQSHFIRTFQKFTGKTPTGFQKAG